MSAEPTSRRVLKRWMLRLAQLGLTVAVTWFILSRLGLTLRDVVALESRWWRPDPLRMAISVVILLSGYLLSGVLWGGMVRDLGGPRLPVLAAVRIYMMANLGRYVPGKVWQILGLAYLSRAHGVSTGVSTSAALLGQGLALAGATGVGGLILLGGETSRAPGIALLVALGLGLAATTYRPFLSGILGLWSRIVKSSEPPVVPGARFGLTWALLYAVNWMVYAMAFWVFVSAYEPGVPFRETGPAFAAAYVLGYLAFFAPAGLGVREGFLVVFLQPALGAGSLALAAVSRLWLTGAELLPALALALWGPRGSAGSSK